MASAARKKRAVLGKASVSTSTGSRARLAVASWFFRKKEVTGPFTVDITTGVRRISLVASSLPMKMEVTGPATVVTLGSRSIMGDPMGSAGKRASAPSMAICVGINLTRTVVLAALLAVSASPVMVAVAVNVWSPVLDTVVSQGSPKVTPSPGSRVTSKLAIVRESVSSVRPGRRSHVQCRGFGQTLRR